MVSTSSLRTRKRCYQHVVDAKTLARIEALSGCDSLDALYAATKSIVAEIGFDHFIYGVRVATSLTHPYQFVFSGYLRNGAVITWRPATRVRIPRSPIVSGKEGPCR